jgi:hypothetical protein
MVKKRTLTLATLAILVWAISVTSLFGYYYLRFQEYVDLSHEYEAVTMRVNIAIDYGNGTKAWHNNTLAPLGATLLNATETIADVQSTPYPEYQAVFVDAINDVPTTNAHWWWWKYWDGEAQEWKDGEIGADAYKLKPRETVMWQYV